MCAGITVYDPLRRNGAGTTAKKVGVIGVGGLGHLGIMFAKALGAEVYAISHSDSKKADAIKMGASHFIATGTDAMTTCKPYFKQLDLISMLRWQCVTTCAHTPHPHYHSYRY